STLTLGPSDTLTGTLGLPLLPALTVIWHPDLQRVGEVAPLAGLYERDLVELTRDEPAFFPPGSSVGRSIDHRAMNRDAVLRVVRSKGCLELHPGVADKKVELDGAAFESPRRLDPTGLRRGLILTVGSGFVFCLHGIHYPVSRSPNFGLLGSGDA